MGEKEQETQDALNLADPKTDDREDLTDDLNLTVMLILTHNMFRSNDQAFTYINSFSGDELKDAEDIDDEKKDVHYSPGGEQDVVTEEHNVFGQVILKMM